MWDLMDRYHEWLPLEIPTHHPENRYYPTGYVIRKVGKNEYINQFSRFYDSQAITVEGYTKQQIMEALSKWAERIHLLNLRSENVNNTHK